MVPKLKQVFLTTNHFLLNIILQNLEILGSSNCPGGKEILELYQTHNFLIIQDKKKRLITYNKIKTVKKH